MAFLDGTGKDSGAEVRTPSFATIWTVRDGRSSPSRAPHQGRGMEAVGLDSEA